MKTGVRISSGVSITSIILRPGMAKKATAHASNISVSRWTTGSPRLPVSGTLIFASALNIGSSFSVIFVCELSPACCAEQDVDGGWFV